MGQHNKWWHQYNRDQWKILFDFYGYRKILNDLSSDTPAVPRIEEEKNEEDQAPAITTVTVPTPVYQTSNGQYSECNKEDRTILHPIVYC